MGALALSASLAAITFQLARNYLLNQRDRSIQRQTFASARLVREALRTEDPDVPRLLTSLRSAEGSSPVLFHDGRWYAASIGVGRDDLPVGLRAAVASGDAARQLFESPQGTRLAIGVPLPAADAAYYEVFPLEVLSRTLLVLRNSLAAGAAITTVAGATLGLFASRRVLRPVSTAAEAATAVAAGRLDVRMDDAGDPDLARLAQAFNRMTEAVQDRIQREERFASAVSHELRTPLTTLAASVEVLQTRREELSPKGRDALALLAAELARFERLVQDLLEMSRIDAGAAQVSFEEVVVAELVLRVVDQVTDEPLPVEVEDAALGLVARVDKRRIERVLVNLVDNARLHGGGVERIAVVAGSVATVRVMVDDAGPGVDQADRERVFERFARGRASGRTQTSGSGLGLAIVAEHVRLHGGSVWVGDAPGGGARFVVELPTEPAS